MEEKDLEQKYIDFIQKLIDQVSPLLPEDVNELQKNYLCSNMKKSAIKLAESMQDDEYFKKLSFEDQCFYIQVMAEWSFHKEIDLFRSGIPAKYWKTVMQKIWYAMWEVMHACVINDAPESVVLILVERFINRTYKDAVEELKVREIIDDTIEEKAKEQSNINKMAEEIIANNKLFSLKKRIITIVLKMFLAIIISAIVSFIILKFKLVGLSIIVSLLVVYNLIPIRNN